jgi:hypothetical protein
MLVSERIHPTPWLESPLAPNILNPDKLSIVFDEQCSGGQPPRNVTLNHKYGEKRIGEDLASRRTELPRPTLRPETTPPLKKKREQ